MMINLKKTAIAAVAALSMTVAFAPTAEAGWRTRAGGVLAAGLIGGALLGSVIANAQPRRPAYAPVYVDPGYAPRPVYAPRHVYASEQDCYRKLVGYRYDDRPIFRTVCN